MFKQPPILKFQDLFRHAARLILVLLSPVVCAQTPASELAVKLHLERSAIVDGKEKMLVTERAAPGEVLQYVAIYSNQTHLTANKDGKIGVNERALKSVTATLPIPEQMVYLGKANPTPQLGSSDGKVFGNYPLTKTIKQADGSSKTVPVEWSEYRALRWTLADIAPKVSSTVSAAVQVNQKTNVQTNNTVVSKP